MKALARSCAEALATHGFVVLPRGAVDLALDPWALIESLLAVRPLLVERQPIRPIEAGRSFASTRVFTPLHTDSQDLLGAPPALQVMICKRPAPRGGETLLVDGWALLETIEREDAALYRALFAEVRTIPFYFGDVVGPTVAKKHRAIVLTHSPMSPNDSVGRALAPFIEVAPRHEIAIREGEVLLVDNHRMLHGRQAFDGSEREFLRLLAWLESPLSNPIGLESAVARWGVPFGAPKSEVVLPARLALVLEMMTGVPPAKLAARAGVPEADLYAWRNAALRAAARALAD